MVVLTTKPKITLTHTCTHQKYETYTDTQKLTKAQAKWP